jgi:hypothetical protein
MKKTLLSLSLLALVATSAMANDVQSNSSVPITSFAPTASVACWFPGRGGTVEECTVIHLIAISEMSLTSAGITTTVVLLLKRDNVVAMVEKYEATGELPADLASLIEGMKAQVKADSNLDLSQEEILRQIESQIF